MDALLGTGVTGAPRAPFDRAIDAINRRGGRQVLAVDVPSGLDCDTGEATGGAVIASHTATFVARKTGFTKPTAARYLGEVRVVDIGVPHPLIRAIASGDRPVRVRLAREELLCCPDSSPKMRRRLPCLPLRVARSA